MDKLDLKEAILKQIQKPVIPARTYSVQEFGVTADSGEIQTATLQQAIDAVSAQGGGKLEFSAGCYRTGALQLKSGVELHLKSKDSVISFVSENPTLHYPVVFSHWEATPCCNFSPLIYACEAHDIAVTGYGVLDGGADAGHWWNWHHQVENAWSDDKPDLQLHDRRSLRQMNLDGVPVAERIFGPGHYLRPNFIQPIRCERVLLQGFTLRNSPMWQLNPVMCKSITVDGVTLSSHGPNNDGCDPESCNGVHICNCRFDTGDDCISLKSGRDRDGRIANVPCENVLIENNDFADGHGGVALGSEMSGGIRRVLAVNNRFSSPNLTYALRLKTNARRGGKVEDIILADSVMDHVHGAAVHGTMLYEDGRNGSDLPVFCNITIENIVAHGGDYGIFLEAFDEVPITGLVLRNICIDGVAQPMRSMNWENPVVENVIINEKHFPRPGNTRILDVPWKGAAVKAESQNCGGAVECRFFWETSQDGGVWNHEGESAVFLIPEASDAAYIRVTAVDADGNQETSRVYTILTGRKSRRESQPESQNPGKELPVIYAWNRLRCRNMLDKNALPDTKLLCADISREQLAKMMMPLANPLLCSGSPDGKSCSEALRIAIGNGFLAVDPEKGIWPEGPVTRQEMATVAMQACGVNYRNASSTMPVCTDVEQVGNNYGTNVARALYFGFMELEPDGSFAPKRSVSVEETVEILNRVADFAGI